MSVFAFFKAPKFGIVEAIDKAFTEQRTVSEIEQLQNVALLVLQTHFMIKPCPHSHDNQV